MLLESILIHIQACYPLPCVNLRAAEGEVARAPGEKRHTAIISNPLSSGKSEHSTGLVMVGMRSSPPAPVFEHMGLSWWYFEEYNGAFSW